MRSKSGVFIIQRKSTGGIARKGVEIMDKPKWFQELTGRGLFQDISDEERLASLPSGSRFYVGFDPTAPSLQLGNLVPLVVAIHLARGGLLPVILFGGATGSIGDPSGKDKERTLLEAETITANIERQRKQVEKLFRDLSVAPEFVNNLDWTQSVPVLDFLRDTGKHLTVNYMIAKEVVKTRLEGHGISFTEFSYMLLQAMDFDHLLRTSDVVLQIGGSDQWGNITAGLELIRKKGSGEAVAFSFPLVTDSAGKKFGKSEDGALWLDKALTSPYKLHQYFLNVDDVDAIRYLKIFTFLTLEEIQEVEKAHLAAPEKRLAQNTLADQLVELIHGKDELDAAKKSREVLFGGSLEGISEDRLLEIFEGVPSSERRRADIIEQPVIETFTGSSLAQSRGEAKRLISGGGGYVNNVRVEDSQALLNSLPLPFPNVVVLRSGKKKYHLIRIVE